MKTPVVTVMRTQGARRRHQQMIKIDKLRKWLDSQKRWLAEMEEKNRKERIEYHQLLGRLSDRFSL